MATRGKSDPKRHAAHINGEDEMKVGDLVRPSRPRECGAQWRRNRVGVVTEVSADDVDGVSSIFVRWNGNSDWSLEYSDNVEVISESR